MKKATLSGAVLRTAILWAVLSLVLPAMGQSESSDYWDTHAKIPTLISDTGLKTYAIRTAEELAYISKMAAMGNDEERRQWLGAKYELQNDIDLSAHYWYPVKGQFAGTFDGRGHTLRGLRIRYVRKDRRTAFFRAGGSGFTVKDLVLEDCSVEGHDCYTALLFGQIGVQGEAGGSGTISNVRVRRGRVVADDSSSGGLVGEVYSGSSVTITGCTVDADLSGAGSAAAGLIGKLFDKSTAHITNSFVRTAGNHYFDTGHHDRAAMVGYVTKQAFVEIRNSGVQSDADDIPLSSDHCGLVVGSLYDHGNCTLNGIYLTASAPRGDDRLYWYPAEGRGTVTCENVKYTLPKNFYSQYETRGTIALALARMNQDAGTSVAWSSGSGLSFEAAADEGRVVEYGQNARRGRKPALTWFVTRIAPLSESERALPESEMHRDMNYADDPYVVAAGLPVEYTALPVRDKRGLQAITDMAYAVADTVASWIIRDQSEGMADRERTGKYTFRGTPSAEGRFDFSCAYRPQLVWRKQEYNPVRLAVELEWAVQNEASDFNGQWAGNGAQWVVERNGVAIDTLDAGERSYTDTHFVYGQSNTYAVYLVSAPLFYGKGDNPEVLSYTTFCDGVPEISIRRSGQAGHVSIQADMPNAEGMDGCTVALYKVVDDGTGEAVIPGPGTDQKPLQTKTFHAGSGSRDNYVQLTFTDDEDAAPCHVWHYKVMCYGFASGPFYGKTLESNVADMLAQNSVAVARFTAAKGESTDKVRIEWQTTAEKAYRNVRYELARHLVASTDTIARVLADADGWKVVSNATNENSVNTYTDEVLPGYVYLYRLRAYPPCDGSYARDVYVETTDIGYAASRGTIMGSVKYGTAGTAVRGVDVRLTPDDNSLQLSGSAYALSFVEDNDVLPLAPGLTEKFWAGSWTVQLLVRPQGNTEQSHLLTVPGRVQVDALGGDLLLAGRRMTLPARLGYNAVMLSHDAKKGCVRLGYALDPGVQAEDASPVHWCAEISDADLAAWMEAHYTSPVQGDTADIDPALAAKYDRPLLMLWLGSAHRGTARPAFDGYIDEVRLWSAALTDDELANTYDRYLSGNEQKLAAYYTFDAGVAEMAFDGSHPGGKWNNRNVALPRIGHPALEAGVLPTGTVLCYRSTTDENGEYQISGVPFMGEGTNYQVVPIYGTHEFQPASTRRYVSQQSLTHAEVNFTDQSAFTVPVQACYAFGNIPAEGLYVSVDGVNQFDSQRQLVRTDADGRATVSVPIGRHTIALSADGHTLVAGGQPCTITGISAAGEPSYVLLSDSEDGRIDFQYDRTAPMTFYDRTLVRAVGRVAGGTQEAGKPVGFHKGSGNLGQMVLRLVPSLSKEYFVNDGKQDPALNPGAVKQDIGVESDAPDSIATTTLYPLMKSYVEVKTDARTGEWLAMLPPVGWTVESVKSAKDGTTDFDLSRMAAGVAIDMSREQADTLWHEGVKDHDPSKTDTYDTFKYRAKRDFILYSEPVLAITNALAALPADSLMLGTDSIRGYYTDPESGGLTAESVPVWRQGVPHDGTAQAYALGAPVFGTGEKYRLRIRVSERYRNHDTGEESDVPVKGVKLQISNRLASVYFKEATTGGGSYELLDTVQAVTGTTEEAGQVTYAFTGGVPNPSGDHLLPMTVSYSVAGADYVHALQGLVVGTVPQPGSNFVTKGPNKVFFVLRDPPGSNSSAWIESGTTLHASQTRETFTQIEHGAKYPVTTGVEATSVVVAGLGTGYMVKQASEVTTTNGVSYRSESEGSITSTDNTSYTFTEKVETSSSSDYVDAAGDVYIGNSTNLIYSKADNVNILQDDHGELVAPLGRRYALSLWQGLSRREETGTVFYYSQREITEVQIPNLKQMRNDAIQPGHWVSGAASMKDYDVPALPERFNVYALEASRDKDVWEEGTDYKVALPSSYTGQEGIQDSVTLYNSWISGWEQCIASEEQFKLQNFKSKESYTATPSTDITVEYGYRGNTSFDAGASVSDEFRFSNDSEQETSASTTLRVVKDYKTVAAFKDGSVKEITNSTQNVVALGTKATGASGTEITGGFGYTLADPDQGDHFSVDIWRPGHKVKGQATGNDIVSVEPYVFRTVAGQSQMPWEGPQQTLYYKENGQSVALDGGTENLDQPYIAFSQRRLTGVPSGTAASVKVTVANLSTATVVSDQFDYLFRCLGNARGLQVEVNGQPLESNTVRFKLLPGTTREYTVTLKQSQVDVTDYDDLVFSLKYDNEAYDTLSVSFAPAAPEVAMRATDGYVVNAERRDGRLPFQLSGYNADFYAFTGVRMQYKAESEQEWHTQKLLINDRERYEQFRGTLPAPWQELRAGGDTATVDFSLLPDGRYQVRAESFSLVTAAEELTFGTDPLTVTKDTQAPELFGTPLPADGLYEQGKEISVTFNEPINEAAITQDNFYVTAVLNDAEVTHKSGLHFEGDTPAKTSARVELLDDDASVGLWFKPVPGRRSCLLSQRVQGRDGAQAAFKLYYNADSTFTLQLADTAITSRRKALGGTDWMYLVLTNDKDERHLELYCLYGTSTKTESSFITANLGTTWGITNSHAPLYVGGSADHDPCYADMEGLVIYDEARTFENVVREKDSKHSANLRGLMAYWPMDEGSGSVAADKVHQRNLTLSGVNSWYMPVTNYAMTFDAARKQHVELMTDQFSIFYRDDYVLEFLFRTAEERPEGMMTLFSNGFGGDPEQATEDAAAAAANFSVSLDAGGSIVLAGGGMTFEPMGSGYNDGQWHHFALNVQRDGYVTVMVDTVDVTNDYHVLGNDFGNLSAARVALGARRQFSPAAQEYRYDRFFSGCIDEVRIWSAYRTDKVVKSMAYNRLKGDEPGLVAYYPFERTDLVSGQEKTTPTLEDRFKGNAATGQLTARLPLLSGYPQAADSAALAAAVTTDKGMAMRAADFMSRISVDYVFDQTSRNRISFSFPALLDKARIEGCTVNFSVQNLKDMSGNLQTQPVKWNVAVNQKAVTAYLGENSLTQEIGTSAKTTIMLFNYTASAQNFTFDGIPAWARVSAASGTIPAQSFVTVDLTTEQGTGIGHYSGTLYVSGDDNLENALPLSLTVTGKQPGWTVADTGSDQWMAILGMLKVKGVWSTSESDIVAAFDAEGRCHGIASPAYSPEMDAYFVHMDLTGGMPEGNDTLTFKVWESATGMTYSRVSLTNEKGATAETLRFADKKFVGNFNTPCIFSALPVTEQRIELRQGWNWVSLWVQPAERRISELFQVGRGSVDEVKQWYAGTRRRPVTTVSLQQSYHVHATEPCTLVVEGEPVRPDTVPVYFNYNSDGGTSWIWLGYPVSGAMTLEQAFADFYPASGDVIKSATDYAVFNGTAWVGKLRYLTPGHGYHYGYNGLGNSTWTYPDANPDLAQARAQAMAPRAQDGQYRFSLTVSPLSYEDYTATQVIVIGEDGNRYPAPVELAAFSTGGECRGVIDLEPGETGPMAIYGEPGEEFSFRLYDKEQQAELPLWGTKQYDETTPCQSVTLYVSPDAIRTATATGSDGRQAYDTQGRRYGDPAHRRGVFIGKGKKTTRK